MKEIITSLLLFTFSGCANHPKPKDAFECFTLFQKATHEGDFELVEYLTNSNFDSPKAILSKYNKPFLEIIPETDDGAFGVKMKPGITLFYVKLRDDNFMVKDTFAVGVIKDEELGYKISHFSKPGGR
jgi:hypothetical protein